MSNNELKIIHLISDLHLSEDQPHLFDLLAHYMQNIAPQSAQLFVLGDLFEIWVGDDHHTAFNQSVIDLFANYSGDLFFAHGNRDFLIGDAFAKACGGSLIQEPHNFEWGGKRISLVHGDSLCTDDIAYQQLRSMVRNSQWQSQFLSQSVEQRLAFAAGVMQQSKDSQKQKSAEIMDVNSQAVIDCIDANHCDWLIHGHTHRPDMHSVLSSDGRQCSRWVLSDWDKQGHYLALKERQISSHYFQL